jgi:hypothetical protein
VVDKTSSPPPERSEPPAPPVPLRAPEPAFFDDPTVDNLIAVTLELGGELWLQKERTRMLESVLIERGILTRELLDAWQPSDVAAERARIEREAYVERVFGVLARRTVRATPES